MPRNIWDLLPSERPDISDRGIWKQISAIQRAPFNPGGGNIWTVLGNCPGGMWQALEDETILLKRRKCRNIWDEVNDETLIIRPRHNLWSELARAPIHTMGGGGVWAESSDKTMILVRPVQTVWSQATEAGNFLKYKPVRRLGWAIKKLQPVNGEPYHILKNLRSGLYLKLSEEQLYLWNLMDGKHSVQDMAVAYFIQYKSLAIQGLLILLGQLEARGFLVETHKNAYAAMAVTLGGGRGKSLARRLVKAFVETTFSIRGIDGLLTKLYRGGFFLIYKIPVQIFILAISVAGVGAFIYQLLAGRYSVITGGGESIGAGLIALYAAQFFAILCHELSHALTCKHYGREVRRAGFMIYLGMPAFFVDTTDIWMEPRKPRLLVSWAGPYSGFFLAGIASLITLVVDSPFTGGLLYQFAFSCLLLSVMNLNPLLQWDGYYMLMDWLEIPMLRARAQAFVKQELRQKIHQRSKFTREEKVFSIFGVLSIFYTGLTIFFVLKALGSTILGFLQRLFGTNAGLIITLALTLSLVGVLVTLILRSLTRKKKNLGVAPG